MQELIFSLKERQQNSEVNQNDSEKEAITKISEEMGQMQEKVEKLVNEKRGLQQEVVRHESALVQKSKER